MEKLGRPEAQLAICVYKPATNQKTIMGSRLGIGWNYVEFTWTLLPKIVTYLERSSAAHLVGKADLFITLFL